MSKFFAATWPVGLYSLIGAILIYSHVGDTSTVTLCVASCFILWLWKVNRRRVALEARDRHLRARGNIAHIVVCAGLWLGVYVFGQMLSYIIFSRVDGGLSSYSSSLAHSDVTSTVLLIFFVAPVFEELLFRMFIITAFMKRGGSLSGAVLVSIVVFALVHGTLPHIPATLSLGLFNAYLFVSTGKVRYSIASHIIYNVSVIVFNVSLVTRFVDTHVPAVAFIPAVCAAYVWVMYMLWKKTTSTLPYVPGKV